MFEGSLVHGRALGFEQLPDPVQDHIFSLVATASCPTQSLLASVSKEWSAAASQHSHHHGVKISLDLPTEPTSPQQEGKQQPVERLESLTLWLARNGHIATSLRLRAVGSLHADEEFSSAAAKILEALAAAGTEEQPLRLRALQVPALGCCTASTISSALSCCHKLRQLSLGALYGPQPWDPASCLQGVLPEALHQLKRLTSLTLYIPPPKPGGGVLGHRAVSLNSLCKRLPRGLLVLQVHTARSSKDTTPPPVLQIDTCCLRHLVRLQLLRLSRYVRMRGSQADNPMTRLTALTHLLFREALAPAGHALLAAPNLINLQAWHTHPALLTALQSTSTLRELRCGFLSTQHDAGAAALAQLTQLTGLRVWAEARPEVLRQEVEVWSDALSALTCLRSLVVESALLSPAAVSALTSLTHLELTAWWGERSFSYDHMQQVLQGLTAGHSQLQRVVLHGVPSEQCICMRAVLPPALSDV